MNEVSGGIYDITSCPLCGLHQETINHILSCPELKKEWLQGFRTIAGNIIRKHNASAGQSEHINLDVFLNTFEPFKPSAAVAFSIEEWVKGSFHQHQLDLLRRHCTSNTTAQNLAGHIVRKLQTYFRKTIWPLRCAIN